MTGQKAKPASAAPSSSLTNRQPLTRLCKYHLEKNHLFCEGCEQVVCPKCVVMGPHNNKLHKVVQAEQAFRQRQAFLQKMVCVDLLDKRDQLQRQLVAVEERSEQLKQRKYQIEREVKRQYSETLARLKEAEGMKLAVLHHQMGQLQRDLQAINSLGNDFFFLTNRQPAGMVSQNAMIAFLVKERDMRDRLEEMISKPFKQNVDVFPYDLPRDVTEKRLLLQRARRTNAQLSLKNELIWRMLQQVKDKEESIRRETQIAIYEQMAEWTKLKDSLVRENSGLDLVCKMCQARLSKHSVNENCVRSLGRSQRHLFLPRAK